MHVELLEDSPSSQPISNV